MTKVWETDPTSAAVKNKNIKLEGSSFVLAPYTGGSNEAEAPDRRIKVTFQNGPMAEMWVCGDKKSPTPRVGPVKAFSAANNRKDGLSVRLRVTQPAPGELFIERAI